MIMEHWWIDNDRGKPNYLEENLSQCHFVHRKCYYELMTGLDYISGVCGDRPAINGVRHGKTTSKYRKNKGFHKCQTLSQNFTFMGPCIVNPQKATLGIWT